MLIEFGRLPVDVPQFSVTVFIPSSSVIFADTETVSEEFGEAGVLVIF
jgi:hypothetical protein